MALVLTTGAAAALSVLLDDGMGGVGSAVPPWALQGAPRAEGADRDAGGEGMNGSNERRHDGNEEHLGGRRFNAIGFQVRKLEQRVRSLEERLAIANRREPRSEEEKSNERGSRS